METLLSRKLFPEDWAAVLSPEVDKHYFKNLGKLVAKERKKYIIHPRKEHVFRAFFVTPYTSVRVVILGQDPYHDGSAHGLSFSSQLGIPPSLRIIYEEIERDLGITPENSGDLTRWARQGVLLLNTVLTVRAGSPNSHKGIGWESFTSRVLEILSGDPVPTVFMLWGKYAQKYAKHIDASFNLVLETPHPASELYSGRTSGFIGSNVFTKANLFLVRHGMKAINWQ